MSSLLKEAGIYYRHIENRDIIRSGERVFHYKWTYLPTNVSGINSIVALASDIFPLINRWNSAPKLEI